MRLAKAAIIGLMVLPMQAQATTYLFTQAGYSAGATATGAFTGNDLNNDGIINSLEGEVSSFSLNFSGNSIVDAFSLDASSLIGLYYGPAAFSIITASVPQFLLNSGPGGSCTPVCSVVIAPSGIDFAAQSPTVSAVPEATTWALLITGFAAVGYALRRRSYVVQFA
jgi:hypothetical protein